MDGADEVFGEDDVVDDGDEVVDCGADVVVGE